MKKGLLLLSVMLIHSILCFSQYVVQTPYAGSNIQIPMNYGSSNKLTHYKYDFTVLLSDSTIKQIRGRIKYDKKVEKYLIKSSETVIYCDETFSIYRIDKDNNDTIVGDFKDDKWLFTVIDGDITGYSIYASNQKGYITHLQKGDSDIFKYERKFLKNEFANLIVDDMESYELYLKDKKRRKFRAISPPIILATCITVSIIAPAGSAIAIVSWIGAPILPFTPKLVKRISPIEIITTYNENKRINNNETQQ